MIQGHRAHAPDHALKILILKPSSLGDVVQALPVLRLIRRHHPTAIVHWWITDSIKSLLQGDPDIQAVIPFIRKSGFAPSSWLHLIAQVRRMRAEAYDLILDLQGLARSGAVGWLAKGQHLLGLDDHREGARAFQDTYVPRRSPDTHAVDWYLQVLAPLGIPIHPITANEWFPVREDDRARMQARLQACPGQGPWIGLMPGARWLNKRWPASHFKETVRIVLQSHPGARFLILGGGEDSALARTIVQTAPASIIDLTGATTLPELVETIRLLDLVITNDTGPMHMAAALERPCLSLFGPTDPRRTGPHAQLESVFTHPLDCAPCMSGTCRHTPEMECLTAISPQKVASRALSLLPAEITTH